LSESVEAITARVYDQLAAARSADVSATHRRRVRELATTIVDERDGE
jgi:hypothetical protein